MPVCVNGLKSPSSCVVGGGRCLWVLPCCSAAAGWPGVSKRVLSPAGRDGAAVDRVADGPQRGGEGHAAARSRAGRRPQRESEPQLWPVGAAGLGGGGGGSTCTEASKFSPAWMCGENAPLFGL